MKNNRGFTLVELISVITLLSAIILVTVPVIINTIKKNDLKLSESFENSLKQAAEFYVERNRDKFPDLDNIGGNIEIPTEDLVKAGYLKQDLENPIDNSSVLKYKVIIEVGNDNIFIYRVERENEKNN